MTTEQKPRQAWQCCRCDAIHDFEDDAAACCADIQPVFLCPVCDTHHDTSQEAQMCCEADKPEYKSDLDALLHAPISAQERAANLTLF